MFKRISYTIALQFTAFVFLLFIVNGILFLAADFGNARRQSQDRLKHTMEFIEDHLDSVVMGVPVGIPPPMRDRVRIIDVDGKPLYTGSFFSEIPFDPKPGIQELFLENEQYRILTSPILLNREPGGFIQVADVERFQSGDLPLRALLYLFVSITISALTFMVGLYFARRSLKPAEHMVERLEQFTQDASHELRTPLATLNSTLDLALKTGNLREGIVSAKQDVAQVSVLVERLLELARLDTFLIQSEELDLSGLVEETVHRHQLIAQQRNIVIEHDIAPGVKVRGDASLIRQILSNLLMNAIKFSKSEGGAVRVMLKPESLSVVDHGVGIAHADVAHIFDRFYQADASRAKGGFGLGLALVKRIVDLHGWSIDVKSAPGKGTTFTVHMVQGSK